MRNDRESVELPRQQLCREKHGKLRQKPSQPAPRRRSTRVRSDMAYAQEAPALRILLPY